LDSIEDEEKREKLRQIIDQVDAARELAELKEYALKCKIKPFDLEKPGKIFGRMMNKYNNSTNNIYHIDLANSALYRHLSQEGYDQKHIDAFFICFCKYTTNFTPENVLQHAYMYYVLYYCAMLDSDRSVKFKNNIKEVIDNLIKVNGRVLVNIPLVLTPEVEITPFESISDAEIEAIDKDYQETSASLDKTLEKFEDQLNSLESMMKAEAIENISEA
ncbi:MAG: hypothetical protein HUJ56_00480, partial [Erysipelotrichaceae bacterium]|nr:hypothetical protein [Erysipelotrichaceae bacterium]